MFLCSFFFDLQFSPASKQFACANPFVPSKKPWKWCYLHFWWTFFFLFAILLTIVYSCCEYFYEWIHAFFFLSLLDGPWTVYTNYIQLIGVHLTPPSNKERMNEWMQKNNCQKDFINLRQKNLGVKIMFLNSAPFVWGVSTFPSKGLLRPT